MSVQLLAAGYANVDLVARVERLPGPEDDFLTDRIETCAGGKGANLACAAARLGLAVEFYGVLGQDPFGDFLFAQFRACGVDASRATRRGFGHTTRALITVDRSGQRTIVGERVDFDFQPLWTRVSALVPQGRCVLHLDGRWAPMALDLLALARQRGLLTSADLETLDPEYRALETLAPVLAQLDVVFLNRSLMRALGGGWQDTLCRLEKLGPGVVVFTRGELGAALCTQGRIYTAPAPQVPVVDTTGAGDVFGGAFLYGLVQGWELEKALRFACAAGAYAVTAPGARGALPTLSDVTRLLEGG